ncbi:hypothetical protein EKO04_007157 [Ascochyta lentis]|uniref:Myb-like domain-containing protein n=1 Tax=Ascochyta lentis TaxID=205686 RepID=A0A8H7J0F4_9PLEO|nr:hypothetical protein EKO04_007157 [Ascochyta lentis]
MPPKKATTSESSDGKFTWEGANENKLLLIILGRHIQTSEFEEVARAFPGATPGAIRNRLSVLRSKQRKVYEELGWEVSVSTAGGGMAKAKAKGMGKAKGKGRGMGMGTPSKRSAAAFDEEDGGVEMPTKRQRGEEGGKGEEEGEVEEGDVEEAGGDGDGVKVEVEEV